MTSWLSFGPDGKIITNDSGSSDIENFEDATGSPWVPPILPEALSTDFIDGNGNKVDLDVISGKTLGFYFSAH